MDGLLSTSVESDFQSLKDGNASWFQTIKALPFALINRLRRGGLGLIVRIAAVFFGIIFVYSLFTPKGQEYQQRFKNKWQAGRGKISSDNHRHLRIVVFGSQDVMSSAADAIPDRFEDQVSWPQQLCNELRCDSLVSLVPNHGVAPSLTSKGVYGRELDNLQHIAEQSDIVDIPSADYFFLREQYPVSRLPLDFDQQIKKFYTLGKPEQPPDDTIWIFTFGTWDIWNLAAMPIQKSEPMVDLLTDHIFRQIERLYMDSLNSNSIAFTDFWGRKSKKEIEELTDPDPPKDLDQRRVEGFRVLIPELFDLSLAAGWHSRPEPPIPYSDAQQVRNSAVLTKRWNARMSELLEDWNKNGSSRPYKLEGKPDLQPIELPQADATLYRVSPPKEEEHKEEEENEEGEDNDDNEENDDEKKDEEEKNDEEEKHDDKKKRAEEKKLYAPWPRRVGHQSMMASRIVDAMTEEEMQRAGAKDSNGRGDADEDDQMRFKDVWKSCIENRVKVPKIPREPPAEKCEVIDDHLWLDGFTVAQRAVKYLAKRVSNEILDKLLTRRDAYNRPPNAQTS